MTRVKKNGTKENTWLRQNETVMSELRNPYKTYENKQQNKRCKSYRTNNYLKCK